MIRIVALLALEASALAAMLAMRIEVPWTDLNGLVAAPEELVAAGLVRAAGIGVMCWLLGSTLAYTVAVPIPRLRHAVGRVTAPVIRRIVDAGLAATLSLSLAAPVGASEAPPEPIVVTVEETTAGTYVVLPPGVTVTTPVVEPAVPAAPAAPAPGGVSEPAVNQAVRIDPTPWAPPVTTRLASHATQLDQAANWTVRTGDHLWAIAEQVLMLRTGRPIVPDHEIAPFWRHLIEVNRSTLRSGDPDLIFPGEMLTIPKVIP